MKRIYFDSLLSRLPAGIKEHIYETGRDNLTVRVIRGSFWALTGSMISKGFFLVSSIIVARILGRSIFGELGIIQSTINMFAAFAGFGLGVTSTKYIAEFRDKDPDMAGNIIASSKILAVIIGIVFTAIFFIMAPWITGRMIGASDLADEMRLGSLMLFFFAVNGAQTGAIAGFENFKDIAKINISVGLFSFPVQIVLTYFLGLYGAIIGLGLTYLFQWILNSIFLRRTAGKFNIQIRLKKSFKDLSYLWEFSTPAFLGGIIVSLVLWYANTMLVSNVNGFNEMAVFNAANQWQNIVLFIPMAVSQISLPLFSNSKDNLLKLRRLIKYNIILNLSICLVLATSFALFSKIIMNSYGSDFREGHPALVILVFTAVFISINSVIGQIIAGLGRMWTGFLINMLWATVFLVLASYFINHGSGAIGLAQSMLFSYLLHTILVAAVSVYFIKKRF